MIRIITTIVFSMVLFNTAHAESSFTFAANANCYAASGDIKRRNHSLMQWSSDGGTIFCRLIKEGVEAKQMAVRVQVSKAYSTTDNMRCWVMSADRFGRNTRVSRGVKPTGYGIKVIEMSAIQIPAYGSATLGCFLDRFDSIAGFQQSRGQNGWDE